LLIDEAERELANDEAARQTQLAEQTVGRYVKHGNRYYDISML
jgi:hypothetical protein